MRLEENVEHLRRKKKKKKLYIYTYIYNQKANNKMDGKIFATRTIEKELIGADLQRAHNQ